MTDREKCTSFETTNEVFLTAYRREAYDRLQAFLRKSASLEEISRAQTEGWSGNWHFGANPACEVNRWDSPELWRAKRRRVSLWMTTEEWEQLEALADATRLDIGTLLRRAMAEKPIRITKKKKRKPEPEQPDMFVA